MSGEAAEVFEISIPITICFVSDEEFFVYDENDAVHEKVSVFESGTSTRTTCDPDVSATVCRELAEESADLASEEDLCSKDTDAHTSVKKAGCNFRATEKSHNMISCSMSEDNLTTSKESDYFQSISALVADASCSAVEDFPENGSNGLELETDECPPLPSVIISDKTAQDQPEAACLTGERVEMDARLRKMKRKKLKSSSTDSSHQENETEVSLLNMHINSEKIHEKEHQCNLCYRSYMSSRHLGTHMKTHLKSPSLRSGRQPSERLLNKKQLKKSEGETSFTELEADKSLKRSTTTFSCKVCQFSSQCIEQFLIHMKSHWINKPYHCSQCNFSTSSLSNVNKHLYGHVGEELYRCTHCSYKTKYKSTFQKHLSVHSEKKDYQCKLCKSMFRDQYGLKKHMLAHYNNRVSFHKCDQCLFQFVTEEHLFYHKHAHSVVVHDPANVETPVNDGKADLQNQNSMRLYKCDQCEYMSYSFAKIRKHIRIHTREKPLKCNQCEKTFRMSSHLVRHETTHLRQTVTKGKKCCYTGKTTEDPEVHQINHQMDSSIAIELVPLEASMHVECDAALSSSQPIGEHVVDNAVAENESSHLPEGMSSQSSNILPEQMGNSSKLHQCDQCEYLTYNSSNFKQHVRIHTGEKPYKCNQCVKEFRTGSHLNRHKAGHLKQGLLKCENCEYTGRTPKDLEDHRKTHEEDAANGSECGETSLQHLGKHVDNQTGETVHSEKRKASASEMMPIKLHVCNKCNYSTANSWNFKMHSRIHTGEKPHKCDKCSLSFRSSSHLIRHMHTHMTATSVKSVHTPPTIP